MARLGRDARRLETDHAVRVVVLDAHLAPRGGADARPFARVGELDVEVLSALDLLVLEDGDADGALRLAAQEVDAPGDGLEVVRVRGRARVRVRGRVSLTLTLTLTPTLTLTLTWKARLAHEDMTSPEKPMG